MMKKSVIVFVGYVLLWSFQGLLVHGLQKGPTQTDPALIVTLQELLKLLFSLIHFKIIERGSIGDILKNFHRGIVYGVPASLYMVYNNLTFIGLSVFDPSRYFILMQFRIVVTGVVHSWFFKSKPLGIRKWLALFLIMIGAMLKEAVAWTSWSWSFLGYSVVGAQILLSTTAGVANEHLLKKFSSKMTLSLQNIFMYSFSLVLNLAVVGFGGFAIPNLSALPVIINGAILGIVTSMFLRHLDSVIKSIASAVELWLTALLSCVVFGYPFEPSMIAGISILTIGILLFANAPPPMKRKK